MDDLELRKRKIKIKLMLAASDGGGAGQGDGYHMTEEETANVDRIRAGSPTNEPYQPKRGSWADIALHPGQRYTEGHGSDWGKYLDIVNPIPAIARGVQTLAGVPSAPDIKTGISRVGIGMARTGLGALQLTPAAPVIGAFGIAQQGISDVAPDVGEFIHKVTNPFSSYSNPATEIGRNAAEAGDIALQGVVQGVLGSPDGRQMVGRGVGAVLPDKKFAQVSRTFEKKAFKPTYDKGKGIEHVDREIATITRERFNPSRKGLEKSIKVLNDLDNTSQPIRQDLTARGVTIDFEGLKTALEQSKDQYKNHSNKAEKSKAVDDMIQRVDAVASEHPDGYVPFDAAWEFKQTLQDMVGGKYDEVGGYTQEAAKNAAHILLDDMIYKAPELRKIGLRQRDVIEAKAVIGKRVNQLENADVVNLRRLKGAFIGGGIGTAGGGVPGAIVGSGIGYFADSPMGQHKIAVAFDRLSKIGKPGSDPYGNYKPKPLPPRQTIGGSPSGGTPPNAPQPTNPSDAVWEDITPDYLRQLAAGESDPALRGTLNRGVKLLENGHDIEKQPTVKKAIEVAEKKASGKATKKGEVIPNIVEQQGDVKPLQESSPTTLKSGNGVSGGNPKLLKVKSFKTDEGSFDIYDTEKGGARGRADMFTVLKDKNGWIVRNASVPDNLQKKGIATDFYKKMNSESLKATGKPLRSTQQRVLISGEIVHELSPPAIKLWDSLVRSGYAEKLGEKNYRFLKVQPNAMPSILGGETKIQDLPKESGKPVSAEVLGRGSGNPGKTVRYNRGSVADAVRAAKEMKSPSNKYVFPTQRGMIISNEPPPFGLQHVVVKPNGTHEVVSESIVPNTLKSEPKLTGSEKIKAEEPSGASSKVQDVPIADISTDVDRFQNRATNFSEKTASTIAERYDPNKFDPILLWKDPADGKTYTLNHSRLEGMKRRGAKTIPARYFEGTEQQAKEFAKIESNRLGNAENLPETVNAYREARAANYTKARMKDLFDGDTEFLESISHLDPNSKFMEILNQPANSEFPYIKRFARWVGDLRKAYPDKLTRSHETQIFDFLYGSQKNIDIPKEAFHNLIEKQVSAFDFTPDRPLVFRRTGDILTGTKARADTGVLEARMEQLRLDLNNARTKEERGAIQREMIRLQEGIKTMQKSQSDLFGK